MYFQYFSVLITIVSAIVMVVVSLATAPPNYERLAGLTYETVTERDRESSSRAGTGARLPARRLC